MTLTEFNSLTEEDFKNLLIENGCFVSQIKRNHYIVNPPNSYFTLDSKTYKYAWVYFYGSLIKNK